MLIAQNTTKPSMRKILFSLIIPIFIVGCAKVKEIETPQGQEGLHEVVFHASWDPETRTELQEDGSIWWSPSDEISLFVDSSGNEGYKLTSTNNRPSARVDFVGQIGNVPPSPKYVAVSPYSEYSYYDGVTFRTYLPHEQEAIEGGFDKNSFVSVAISEDENLYFNNICSGIKFSVNAPGIDRIRIWTNDGTGISGNITNSQFFESPFHGFVADCPFVEVVAPSDSGFEPGKNYYAVLLPFKNDSGLTVYFFKDDLVAKWVYDKPIEFKRGVFKRLINKDEGLRFNKQYNSRAYLNMGYMLPEGVDKTTITCAHFHVLSEKQTSVLLTENGAPIYFEMLGTEAHYYTPAEIYEVLGMISFAGWSSLKTLDLSNIDTRNATSFLGMFDGCISLESLDLSGFDTSNVTCMRSMFGGCQNLKSLNLSGFNTQKVTDMFNMFGISTTGHAAYQFGQGCSSLESLDLSMFDTSNVTDMTRMFSSCANLKELNLSGWNTSNVESMVEMFEECYSLKSLDLSSFNTRSLTNMGSMFTSCSSLETIDLSGFDTSNVIDMGNLLLCCDSLREVDLSSFSVESLYSDGLSGILNRCRNLKKIDFGDVAFPQGIQLYGSFFETARNNKACAIRCSSDIKDIIISSSIRDDENPWGYSSINLDYFTFVLPNDPIPDLPDNVDPDLYRSTDYSEDGRVVMLQKADAGRGVDIILVGDAYSDRLIKDGTYQSDMIEAMEAIFSLEPYKSFRNLFNVYMVIAVSPNEVSSGETALNFRTELVPGCQSDVYRYTWNVIKDKYAADIATVVIGHDEDCLAGSGADGKTILSFAYGSDDEILDFGQAREAIAFIPRFSDTDYFRSVVSHEFGHCFAKLADEYVVYEDRVPDWMLEAYFSGEHVIITKLGIYRNIDFTSDPAKIKWSAFLTDSRYADTDTGIFEGGFLYRYGVWRPSATSIMADSGNHFNAPSREAIYNRIHKLAYGYDWVFDFESFVEYDMKNIEAEKASQSSSPAKPNKIESIHHRRPSMDIKLSTNKNGEKTLTIIMD